MCRFLLIKSKKPMNPKKVLTSFAALAKMSKAPDGDWQGDGWGAAWIGSDNNWQVKKDVVEKATDGVADTD